MRNEVDATVPAGWFDAPLCRNCGALLETPYCGQCGQKQAARFAWRDLRHEAWERWRLFEFTYARTLWRLARGPGRVARDYVLGRRTANAHPLKLLVFVVALMALMVATNGYFSYYAYSQRADATLARTAALVQGYGNWSFSLSLFAIFFASMVAFRGRRGFNAIEHAVLATYCQVLITACLLVWLLPTLLWHAPEFIRSYKRVTGVAMYAVKLVIVAVALRQFFQVDLRRDGWRLALALAIYAAASWLLLRAYAHAILLLVRLQAT